MNVKKFSFENIKNWVSWKGLEILTFLKIFILLSLFYLYAGYFACRPKNLILLGIFNLKHSNYSPLAAGIKSIAAIDKRKHIIVNPRHELLLTKSN